MREVHAYVILRKPAIRLSLAADLVALAMLEPEKQFQIGDRMKDVCGFGIRFVRWESLFETPETVISSDVDKSSNHGATKTGGCLLVVIAGFLMLEVGLHAQQ